MISDLRVTLCSTIVQLNDERSSEEERKKVEIKKWRVRLLVRWLEIMMGLGYVWHESTLTVLNFHLKLPFPPLDAETGTICQYSFCCNLPAERKFWQRSVKPALAFRVHREGEKCALCMLGQVIVLNPVDETWWHYSISTLDKCVILCFLCLLKCTILQLKHRINCHISDKKEVQISYISNVTPVCDIIQKWIVYSGHKILN